MTVSLRHASILSISCPVLVMTNTGSHAYFWTLSPPRRCPPDASIPRARWRCQQDLRRGCAPACDPHPRNTSPRAAPRACNPLQGQKHRGVATLFSCQRTSGDSVPVDFVWACGAPPGGWCRRSQSLARPRKPRNPLRGPENMVELNGIEPMTSGLQSPRSPS